MQNTGIGPWIARKALRHADRVAIVHGDERITYGVFAERVARLTDALAARGVAAGQRVAYLGNNHPSLLEVFFATASLGAIFVPLNSSSAGGLPPLKTRPPSRTCNKSSGNIPS